MYAPVIHRKYSCVLFNKNFLTPHDAYYFVKEFQSVTYPPFYFRSSISNLHSIVAQTPKPVVRKRKALNSRLSLRFHRRARRACLQKQPPRGRKKQSARERKNREKRDEGIMRGPDSVAGAGKCMSRVKRRSVALSCSPRRHSLSRSRCTVEPFHVAQIHV